MELPSSMLCFVNFKIPSNKVVALPKFPLHSKSHYAFIQFHLLTSNLRKKAHIGLSYCSQFHFYFWCMTAVYQKLVNSFSFDTLEENRTLFANVLHNITVLRISLIHILEWKQLVLAWVRRWNTSYVLVNRILHCNHDLRMLLGDKFSEWQTIAKLRLWSQWPISHCWNHWREAECTCSETELCALVNFHHE